MTVSAPWLQVFGLVAAAALGCTRPAPAPAPLTAAAEPAPAPGLGPGLQLRTGPQGERIARAAREVSRHPDTEAGLRAFALELTAALRSGEAEAQTRLRREFTPDATRFELALTFDGARVARDRLVPEAAARTDAVLARLTALQGPVEVTVRSARADDMTPASGLDPRLVALRARFHPQVRLHRAVVRAADGTETVLEPMAFLAGQWTWLAEPWTAFAATPGAPTAPPTVAGP